MPHGSSPLPMWMIATRFVATLAACELKKGSVRLALRVSAPQLGHAIRVLGFTGNGHPRPFAVRIAARERAGLAGRARLWAFDVSRTGCATVLLALEPGPSLDALQPLVESAVAIELRDED